MSRIPPHHSFGLGPTSSVPKIDHQTPPMKVNSKIKIFQKMAVHVQNFQLYPVLSLRYD